ncbi:hypothetical protein HELRODRAFT_78021, partial [Helobdella robusta]|uniref:dolichyl-phosphate-mannose--protein mannosyltransferase n=1 Tax=Helobdella robusta TaxID=6412 RepID=T1G368_HELRO
SRAIKKNPDVLGETSVWSLLKNDFWGTPLTHSGSHKSYRPLCTLTFRLNHNISGLNPIGFHSFNIILHCLTTALYAKTIKKLMTSSRLTMLAGLMFASHPVHTEAVSGIVGRADVLSCFFFLLAFNFYISYCQTRQARQTRWKNNASTVCSLKDKEQGVTVVPVCFAYDIFLHQKLKFSQLFAFKRKNVNWTLIRSILLNMLTLLFMVTFRMLVIGMKFPEFSASDNPAADSDDLLTRTLTFLYLPVFNFMMLMYPWQLSFDWSMDAIQLIESYSDPRNILTLTFYSCLIFTLYYILKNVNVKNERSLVSTCNGTQRHASLHEPTRHKTFHTRQRNHSNVSGCVTFCDVGHKTKIPVEQHVYFVMALSLLIFPYIPASNLFFYVGFVVAERVLYMPSLGYCLLFALIVEYLLLLVERTADRKLRKMIIYAFVLTMLATFCLKTLKRNEDWLTEEALYRAGIQVNPAKAWGNLANVLNGQGRAEEAERAYKTALLHRSNMADVHYNLGILYQEQKRYMEAKKSYEMAIQCRPKLTMAHLNLGIIMTTLGKFKEAEQVYRHCSEIDTYGLKDPRLHEQTKISALYNLGRLLADQERHQVNRMMMMMMW